MGLRTVARTPKSITVQLRDRHMAVVSQETVDTPQDAARSAVLIISRRGELHPGDSIRVTGTFEGAEIVNEHRETD